MNHDESDPDLNEIAFIGNEDDERGPGCLIGLAIALATAGLVGLLIVAVYAWSIGLMGAGAGGPGILIGFGTIIVACIFGFFSGGASVGMSLRAVHQSRQQGRGEFVGLAWLSFALALVTIAVSFGLGLAIVLELTR